MMTLNNNSILIRTLIFWSLKMNDNKQKLYVYQKKMIDIFLKIGTINKTHYGKSLNGLKENMVMEEFDK